jgi:hypothetical protein
MASPDGCMYVFGDTNPAKQCNLDSFRSAVYAEFRKVPVNYKTDVGSTVVVKVPSYDFQVRAVPFRQGHGRHRYFLQAGANMARLVVVGDDVYNVEGTRLPSAVTRSMLTQGLDQLGIHYMARKAMAIADLQRQIDAHRADLNAYEQRLLTSGVPVNEKTGGSDLHLTSPQQVVRGNGRIVHRRQVAASSHRRALSSDYGRHSLNHY